MKIELLFEDSKNHLDDAKEKLDTGNVEGSLVMLAMCFSEVRELIDSVWRRKRDAALAANPPGENSR